MSDSTAHDPEFQPALASLGSQGAASAEASSATALSPGQVSGGWDPAEVWLQRIELPRRRRAAQSSMSS